MLQPTKPLAAIEPEAKLHEDARMLLGERVRAYNDALAALARDHLPGIKRALNKAADIEGRLKALVLANPDSFVKPKTHVLHGAKIGFEKAKAKIGFDKPAKVVERIKRIYPDEQAELLIHKEEKPNKETLSKLPAAELKRLGCTIEAGGEQVIVRPVDSTVDKMVRALLKDASEALNDPADAQTTDEAGS